MEIKFTILTDIADIILNIYNKIVVAENFPKKIVPN